MKTEAYKWLGLYYYLVILISNLQSFKSLKVNFHEDEFHVRYSMINTKSAKDSVIGEKINGII